MDIEITSHVCHEHFGSMLVSSFGSIFFFCAKNILNCATSSMKATKVEMKVLSA